MRIPLAIALAVTACGHAAGPPSIGNTVEVAPPACPPDANPFAELAGATAADDCVRGEPAPLLTASAAPPTCHAYQVTGATSAVEAVTLADGRRVWLHQGGCAHATMRFRARPTRAGAPDDRAGLLRAAAALLRDLDPVAGELGFGGFATDLEAAATARPLGRFPIGSGDWFAEIEVDDGAITVELDFPL
ncbi:MAG: hypothetical protein IPL61_08850 [Myxococcales bacterium]|nr:hypothetical protein [Myxococcales bacterium]